MKYFSFILSLALSCSGCVASSSNNLITLTGDSAAILPQVIASDLEGKEYSLPKDFTSDKTIVIFGFSHGQQKAIDTWLPTLKERAKQDAEFSYIEIPVIDNKNAMLRTIIRNGMRTGITESEDRQKTITLFADKDNLLKSLKVSDPQNIEVMVIDKQGIVSRRVSGEYSAEKLSDLLGPSMN